LVFDIRDGDSDGIFEFAKDRGTLRSIDGILARIYLSRSQDSIYIGAKLFIGRPQCYHSFSGLLIIHQAMTRERFGDWSIALKTEHIAWKIAIFHQAIHKALSMYYM
jgi:hypothetical protein